MVDFNVGLVYRGCLFFINTLSKTTVTMMAAVNVTKEEELRQITREEIAASSQSPSPSQSAPRTIYERTQSLIRSAAAGCRASSPATEVVTSRCSRSRK